MNDRTDGGTEAQGLYPPGETVVTFTATDAAGHTASCEAVVTVADTQPPSLQVVLAPASLMPPNHALRSVVATLRAVDVCDASPSIVLESALSSEPDDAPGAGTARRPKISRALRSEPPISRFSSRGAHGERAGAHLHAPVRGERRRGQRDAGRRDGFRPTLEWR